MGRTYSVLAVSAAEKFNASLRTLLPEEQYAPLRTVRDVASARRCLLEQSYDIVLINAPMPDDSGTRLALDVSESSGAGVLLLVRAEQYPELTARLAPFGVLTMQKPTTPQLMQQSLQLLCGTRERKCMTEQEAHRYIEKQAMDRCVSRRTIAEQLIENL